MTVPLVAAEDAPARRRLRGQAARCGVGRVRGARVHQRVRGGAVRRRGGGGERTRGHEDAARAGCEHGGGGAAWR